MLWLGRVQTETWSEHIRTYPNILKPMNWIQVDNAYSKTQPNKILDFSEDVSEGDKRRAFPGCIDSRVEFNCGAEVHQNTSEYQRARGAPWFLKHPKAIWFAMLWISFNQIASDSSVTPLQDGAGHAWRVLPAPWRISWWALDGFRAQQTSFGIERMTQWNPDELVAKPCQNLSYFSWFLGASGTSWSVAQEMRHEKLQMCRLFRLWPVGKEATHSLGLAKHVQNMCNTFSFTKFNDVDRLPLKWSSKSRADLIRELPLPGCQAADHLRRQKKDVLLV